MHDQILASPTIPIVDELFSLFLRLVVPPPSQEVVFSPTTYFSILTSQTIKIRRPSLWSIYEEEVILDELDPSIFIVMGLAY